MSIKVENLTYIYSEGLPYETLALDNVSFEINDGEIFGIIGHTGSGKSTLIQHLNGLIRPKSGKILVGDFDITQKDVKMRDIRQKIGLVFQYPEYQLFEETVAKDIAFGPINLGIPEEEVDNRVKEAISMVGLDYNEIAERSPFDLSGGQKRRIAIAGVIAMKPEVLILDEPTAGLDPQSHQDILNMINDLHKRENNIIVFVSHNMEDIAEMADRIMVMNRGKIATIGTPREVYSKEDIIAEVGLDFPPIMLLLKQLRSKGIILPEGIMTINEAEEAIANYINGKRP